MPCEVPYCEHCGIIYEFGTPASICIERGCGRSLVMKDIDEIYAADAIKIALWQKEAAPKPS